MKTYWLGLCAVVCALGCSSSDDGASGDDPSLDSGGTDDSGSDDGGGGDADTEGGVTPEGFGKISGTGGRYFAVAGNKAYYTAKDSEHGDELWVTDGTTPGTHFVKDTVPGKTDGIFRLPRGAALGDKLVFGGKGDSSFALWVSDGTEAGTHKIHDVDPGDFIGVAGTHAYFLGKQTATGNELWTTDGTTAGTHIVVDYSPGEDSSIAHGPVTFGDKFIFQVFRDGTDGKHGHTYITSGAPGDAVQLTPDSGIAGEPFQDAVGVKLGSNVVFLWLEPTHGQEPWITDGTPAGTHLLKDVVSGINSSYPKAITVLGSKAYFFGYDGSTGSFQFLWETDGTEAGTKLVAKVDTDANVSRLFVKDGKAYFPGRRPAMPSGATDIGLWVTDGTATGTRLVSSAVNPSAWTYYPLSANNSLGKMVAVKDKIVFFGWDKDHGTEPWITDGTDAGTQRLGDVYPGMYGCTYESTSIFELGGKAYFSAVVGSSKWQLFESDGTTAGTKAVMPAGMMLDQTTINGEPVRLPSTIVFSGSFGEGDYGIYKL